MKIERKKVNKSECHVFLDSQFIGTISRIRDWVGYLYYSHVPGRRTKKQYLFIKDAENYLVEFAKKDYTS